MATSTWHGDFDPDTQGIHVPFQFSFADQASRTGAPASMLSGGGSKLALQRDDFSLWILSSVSPTPTWKAVGGSGQVGQFQPFTFSAETSGVSTETGASGMYKRASSDLLVHFSTHIPGDVDVASPSVLIAARGSAASGTLRFGLSLTRIRNSTSTSAVRESSSYSLSSLASAASLLIPLQSSAGSPTWRGGDYVAMRLSRNEASEAATEDILIHDWSLKLS